MRERQLSEWMVEGILYELHTKCEMFGGVGGGGSNDEDESDGSARRGPQQSYYNRYRCCDTTTDTEAISALTFLSAAFVAQA